MYTKGKLPKLSGFPSYIICPQRANDRGQNITNLFLDYDPIEGSSVYFPLLHVFLRNWDKILGRKLDYVVS